jgi:hypothetical protein
MELERDDRAVYHGEATRPASVRSAASSAHGLEEAADDRQRANRSCATAVIGPGRGCAIRAGFRSHPRHVRQAFPQGPWSGESGSPTPT